MMYLMTDRFMSAIWYYRGFTKEMPHIRLAKFPCRLGSASLRIRISTFSRRMMEESFNIVHWANFDDAGHLLL